TFGLVKVKPPLLQVQVFDSEVQRFADTQAASVKQVDQQTGGVGVNIPDLCQQLERFAAVRAIAQAGGTLGAQGVYIPQLLSERIAVEEEQAIEGLVLGGSRDPLQSELGQEELNFGFGGGEGFTLRTPEKAGILLEPVDIGFLSTESGVVEGAS